MSTEAPRTSHLERTSSQPRQQSLFPALLVSKRVESASGSILSFLFRPISSSGETDFLFQPGQWLDLHIPAIPDHVGGFSLISDSRIASESFELAVKKADTNPPAAWLHSNDAQPGSSRVEVRVGGSFVYPRGDATDIEHDHVVFIAHVFFSAPFPAGRMD
jgi:ferredoxin-NADP reductase